MFKVSFGLVSMKVGISLEFPWRTPPTKTPILKQRNLVFTLSYPKYHYPNTNRQFELESQTITPVQVNGIANMIRRGRLTTWNSVNMAILRF